MSSQTTTLRYAAADGVATITLDRPEVFNAFNQQMHRELLAALRSAERDPAVRCVVLTGAGRAFCSGQDLKELGPELGGPRIAELLRQSYNQLVLRMQALPKPIVAAVNGVAAGAGMSLALACDLRVAAAEARFSAAFVRIGLIPDSGMTYFLPRLVGPARAMELCLTGNQIDAATALSWGLVNRVAPAEGLAAAVAELAGQLAAGPAGVLGMIKRGLARSAEAGLAEMLEYEAEAQQVAAADPDFAEGLAAFREKRPPRFR